MRGGQQPLGAALKTTLTLTLTRAFIPGLNLAFILAFTLPLSP